MSLIVQYLDNIYAYIIKPAINVIFNVYYMRAIRNKLERPNQDVLFYSASFLAKQIRRKQVIKGLDREFILIEWL